MCTRASRLLVLLVLALLALPLFPAAPRLAARAPTAVTSATIYIPMILHTGIPDYFDDFSDPTSGWLVANDYYAYANYYQGEYRVVSKWPGYLYLFLAPTDTRINYAIEVDARWVGATGAGYGILFGVKPGYSQFYFVLVNTDYKEFVVGRVLGDQLYELDYAFSDAIQAGNAVNHVRIERNGSEITVDINGRPATRFEDDLIQGHTEFGVLMMPYNGQFSADVRFDNYYVTSNALAAVDSPTAAAAAASPTTVYFLLPQAGLRERWMPQAKTP